MLQSYRTSVSQSQKHADKSKMVVVDDEIPTTKSSSSTKKKISGIDRNDPILQWGLLHQAAGLWVEEK